jgi:hypothetical protein
MLGRHLEVTFGVLGNGRLMDSRIRVAVARLGAIHVAGLISVVSMAKVRVGHAHGARHDGWADRARSVRVGVVEETRIRDRGASFERSRQRGGVFQIDGIGVVGNHRSASVDGYFVALISLMAILDRRRTDSVMVLGWMVGKSVKVLLSQVSLETKGGSTKV